MSASQLRRRLNKAISECKTQASFTARCLVERLRDTRQTMNGGVGGKNGFGCGCADCGGPGYSLAPSRSELGANSSPTFSSPVGGRQQRQTSLAARIGTRRNSTRKRGGRQTSRWSPNSSANETSPSSCEQQQQASVRVKLAPMPIKLKLKSKNKGHYFVRSSANAGSGGGFQAALAGAGAQNWRRASGASASGRRRRSLRCSKQVRFHPIPPTTINISAASTCSAASSQRQHDFRDSSSPRAANEENLDDDDADDDDFGWGSDFDEESVDSIPGNAETSHETSGGVELKGFQQIKNKIESLLSMRQFSGELPPAAITTIMPISAKSTSTTSTSPLQSVSSSSATLQKFALPIAHQTQIKSATTISSDPDRGESTSSSNGLQVFVAGAAACSAPASSASSSASCGSSLEAEADSGAESVSRPASNKAAVDQCDCQSHCSDESGSSSGLDSNHSGSQDSGHSTHHSGYSSSCQEQPVSVRQSPCRAIVPPPPPPPPPPKNFAPIKQQQPNQNLANHFDQATRLMLLRQQREISLRLKQKPRQKLRNKQNTATTLSTTKLATMPDEQHDDDDEHDGFTMIKHDSKTSSNNEVQSSSDNRRLVVTLNRSGLARNSITKQLSMICLRQTSQLQQQKQHQQQQKLQQSQEFLQLNQQQPKAATSLRQLVKDVIDNCEKPKKLSTLTRDLLSRCDSSSSDLITRYDEHDDNNGGLQRRRDAQDEPEETDEERSSPATESLNRLNLNHRHHHAGQLYPTCHSSPKLTAHSYSTHNVNQLQPQTQPHTSEPSFIVEQSYSSMGSIDGLEYTKMNSTFNESNKFDQSIHQIHHHPQLQQHQAAQTMQPDVRAHLKSTLSVCLKSLREFSRFKLPITNASSKPPATTTSTTTLTTHTTTTMAKQYQADHNDMVSIERSNHYQRSFNHKAYRPHLAYLDNSRNFTDDD